MADSDDEPLVLSSHALTALAEFQAEKDAHRQKFETLKSNIVEDDEGGESHKKKKGEDGDLSMTAFVEDWNESQFWYSDETALVLADRLLDGADGNTTIGVLSTPSVFVALKNRLKERAADGDDLPKLVLFEHDQRFAVFPEFVYYDFQQPLKLPGELKASVDRIIIDPPFFSGDCQTKFALTVRWLLKPVPLPPVIVCTGERMAPLIAKLYRSLKVYPTTFEPYHEGLCNHYYCYANFECPSWDWRPEAEADDA